MKFYIKKYRIIVAVLFLASFLFSIFNIVYAERILPHTYIGSISVGSLTREEAEERLIQKIRKVEESGITIIIEGNQEILDPKNIDFKVSFQKLSDRAWQFGRTGKWHNQLKERILALVSKRDISGNIDFDDEKFSNEISVFAQAHDRPRRDIRYNIEKTNIEILYDTKEGRILNQEKAKNIVLAQIASFDFSPISIFLEVDAPRVSPSFIAEALEDAEKMIKDSLVLSYKARKFVVSPELIASWIVSGYLGDRLIPELNKKLISEYVAGLGDAIDTAAQNIRVRIENEKVVEFIPPKQGVVLLQDETARVIEDFILARIEGGEAREISLPVLIKNFRF